MARRTPGSVLLVVVTGGALLALVIGAPAVAGRQSSAAVGLVGVAEGLAAALAAVACGVRARRGGGSLPRRAWAWFAAATASWAAGQALFVGYELSGREAPFPSWADAGFLGFAVAASVALVLAPGRAVRSTARARVLLDGVVLTASVALLSWNLVLEDVLAAAAGTSAPVELAISLGYPVGDLVVGSLALLLVRSTGDRSVLALCAGAVLMAVADSAYAVLTASGAFTTGGVPDLLWTSAFVSFGLAAVLPPSPPSAPGVDEAMRPAALALPFGAFVLALAPCVVEVWRDQEDFVTLVLGTGLMLLVGARQAVALLDNRALLEELTATTEQLQHLAYHDPLTGLGNRGLFRDRLQAEAAAAQRSGSAVVLAYLDVDDFKQVNDRLGHAAGDELLRMVAERLQGSVRPMDLVARLGGDEFAVVVRDGHDAGGLRERLTALSQRPFVIEGRPLDVRISTGVVAVHVSGGTPREAGDAVLAAADRAMYRDKAEHRTAVRLPVAHVGDAGAT